MKIYDCFTFFNELDLLEIRLSELNSYVDYFVLVESNQTHAGVPKKLFYEINKERFKKWNHKIIHVVMDMPKFNILDKLIIRKQLTNPSKFLSNLALSYGLGRWKMERAQRSSINFGLKNANDKDIVIISDVDEIPNITKLNKAISFSKKGDLVGFIQQTYFYYLNGRGPSNGIGTKMCSYRYLRERCGGDPQKIRIPSFLTRTKNKILGKTGYHNNIWNANLRIIENGGWHFTFLGGIDAIKTKIKNYPHIENFSKKDSSRKKIEKEIERGFLLGREITYVPIDNSFPNTIRKNKKKYSRLIKKIDIK
tara:strand:+ start:104 stop:1030 length:927 start_codon:yes stop_codon:yes gene_type:complete